MGFPGNPPLDQRIVAEVTRVLEESAQLSRCASELTPYAYYHCGLKILRCDSVVQIQWQGNLVWSSNPLADNRWPQEYVLRALCCARRGILRLRAAQRFAERPTTPLRRLLRQERSTYMREIYHTTDCVDYSDLDY